MSCVRECVDGQDLDRFDVLVLRKEVESLRNRKESLNSKESSADASSHHSLPSENQSFIFGSDPDVQSSTPRDLGLDSSLDKQADKLSVSPVRPRHKSPPPKPKRSSSLPRNSASESMSSSATEEEPSTQRSQERDHRSSPSSPFTNAIKNHRSSHSGRVKVGSKAAHLPLPDAAFFKNPDSPEKETVEPVYSSVIKPVKNPACELINHRRNSKKLSTASAAKEDINVSTSSAASSSSSSAGEPFYKAPHPPIEKITLRPTTFASSVNDRVVFSNRQPVKVDVHRSSR